MSRSQSGKSKSPERWASIFASASVVLLCAWSIYLHLGNPGGAFRVIDRLNTEAITERVTTLGPRDWCDELDRRGRITGELALVSGPLVGGPFYGLFQTDELNRGLRMEMGPTGKVALIAPVLDQPGAIRVVESSRPIRLKERIRFSASQHYLLLRGADWSASSTGNFSPLCDDVRIGTNFEESRAYPGDLRVNFRSQKFVPSEQNDRRVMIIFCLAAFVMSLLWFTQRGSKNQDLGEGANPLLRAERALLKGAIFVVLLTPFVLVTLGRVWTVSDGWFMSWWKSFQVQPIYDRIAYPYPPASLVEGFVPHLFHRIFLAEQVYHFIIWAIFCITSYKLASEVSRKSIAFFSTVMLSTVYFAMPFNFVAGYFELALTLLLLGLTVFPRCECAPRWKHLRVVLSAMCFITAALTKQTFALVPLVLTVYLVGRYRKKGLSRRFLTLWTVGLSLPLGVVLAWSAINQNLLDLLRNILSGGGKGDVGSGLIERIFDWGILRALNGTSISTLIYLVPLCVLLITKKANQMKSRDSAGGSPTHPTSALERLSKPCELILLLLTIWTLFTVSAPEKLPISGHALRIVLFSVVVVLVANEISDSSLFRIRESATDDGRWSNWKRRVIVGGLSVVPAYLAVRLSRGQSLESFEDSRVFSGFSQTLTTLGVFLSVCALLAYVASIMVPIGKNVISDLKVSSEFARLRSPKVGMAFITALLIPVLNSLSGWTTFETWYIVLLLTIPILVGLLSWGRPLLVAIVFVSYFVSLAASAIEPYQWWGLRVPSLSQSRQEPPSTALSGFLLDTDTVQYLTELRRISNSARDVKGATAFYGPQNVGLQFVLEIDALPTRCLVMWWDVCSIEDQHSTLRDLKASNPKFIFWNVPPGAVSVGHDSGFNTGESVTTRMPAILQEMVTEGRYIDRATLEIPRSNGWSTLVLERKN